MNIRKYLPVLLVCFGAEASAAGYVGVGYGKTDYDADDVSSFDDPSSIEFHAGFKTTENIALEFGYIQFGDSNDDIPPDWHLEMDSLAFSLVASNPISDRAEVFFQIGLHMWDADIKQDGFGVIAEDDGNDLFYGFGVNAMVSDKASLGLRYNSYDYELGDATRLTINAQYNID